MPGDTTWDISSLKGVRLIFLGLDKQIKEWKSQSQFHIKKVDGKNSPTLLGPLRIGPLLVEWGAYLPSEAQMGGHPF